MKLVKSNLYFIVLTIVLSFLISCSTDIKKIPDVSEIKSDGTFSAEAISFFSGDVSNNFRELQEKYPTFFNLYIHNILFPGDTISTDSSLVLQTLKIASDTNIIHLSDTLLLAYDNDALIDIKREFATAFKYLKYYFPEYKTPNVYLCNGLFNYQKFIFSDKDGRDAIGLGGEMFLNDFYDYKLIDPANPAYSNYITRTFNREHMVRKSLDLVIEDLLGPPSGSKMIDQMIRNGKKLFLMEQFLPYANDSIILEYTPGQVAWCKQNELEMWGFFLDKNLFYENSPIKIAKYLNDSPNSPGMPEEAPGRTANYLGMQIVKKYV